MGEEEVAGAVASERAAHPPEWLRTILDGEEVPNLHLSTVEELEAQVGEVAAERQLLADLTHEVRRNNPPPEKIRVMQLAIKKRQLVRSFKLYLSRFFFYLVAIDSQISCWNDLEDFCWWQVEEGPVEEVIQLPWERGVQMLNKYLGKQAPKTRFGTKTLTELSGVN